MSYRSDTGGNSNFFHRFALVAKSITWIMLCHASREVSYTNVMMKYEISKLTSEICDDIEVEPYLLEPTGEVLPKSTNMKKEARLDFCARGFWQRGQRAYFDVSVFAQSYQHQKLDKVFYALVFTPYGGYSRETDKFIKITVEKNCGKERPSRKYCHITSFGYSLYSWIVAEQLRHRSREQEVPSSSPRSDINVNLHRFICV